MTIKPVSDLAIDRYFNWCRMFLLCSMIYIIAGVGTSIFVLNSAQQLTGFWIVVLLLAVLLCSCTGALLLVNCYCSVRNTEKEIRKTRNVDLKDIASRIKKLAYYDAVTKMPNRVHFQRVLEKCVNKANNGALVFHCSW